MALPSNAAMRVVLASSLRAVLFSLFSLVVAANFYRDFDVTWGDGRGKVLNNGQLLTLSLDKASGSGFQSKNEYLFGKIDMQIKLVPGNSAGTVTAYYLSSQGLTHDEIDFEFLGNLSGDPYTLHTNVFSQGKGNREQQFKLWFDPTKDFHTYSILWNPQHILFSVDGIPIRDFRNNEARGVPFPKNQPMRIYSSLWNADDWATRGGLVKTDWSKAPFVAAYRNFNADACVASRGTSSCASYKSPASGSRSSAWWNQELDATSRKWLRWVQRNHMIYNYCADVKRFPQGLPPDTVYTPPPPFSEVIPLGLLSSNPASSIMAFRSNAVMRVVVLVSSLLAILSLSVATAGNFYRDFDVTWGDGRGQVLNNGQLLTLSLDKASGSGFQSKNEYLFGKIDMQIKLVPGNSAGTVTAYYLSSQGPTHDEIDFEFLGNLSGDPYTLHTNVFSQGKGNREQQFKLWFDPTQDFHTYSILWNPQHIMAMGGSWASCVTVVLLSAVVAADSGGNFYQDFDITWGDGRGKILNNGQLLTLSLDKASGSGFQSKNEYLFGKIDMQLKLVPGNSAGTVTAYYLSSQGATHDEIDFEFLGNLTGDPYTLHTNVFSQGKGNREQQFKLWFDPTKDFHTYSILWNPQHIMFSVNGIPIRDFRNNEARGVPFPKNQPMRIYSSLWNADDWATRGGLVKTDWSNSPFVASYRNFNADACVWSRGTSSCASQRSPASVSSAWWNQELDAASRKWLKWVQKNYMIYNYCTDVKRFPQGLPPECRVA
ncbi:hypothetical protein Taro_034403 [Colocasia esculenta]|uniref:xyloglucan:xyloglucosyl transferase n=1 Tax=Colocasia esculenta TaxID=4460 RepID=A0A843W3Z2_COLES|nr:hypothetical protein [Colocasia esculenta]